MLQRSPDRLLSARINELTGTGFARSSQKLSSEQIKNLNLDSIAAFYKKLYTNPQGTTYVICGNFNADTLMQQFVSVFGRIPVSSHLSRFSYPHFNFPWALNDSDNWYHTHRFGGKCMVIGGIAMIVTSPFQNVWIFLALVIVPCILPVVYSYMFYRKTMG